MVPTEFVYGSNAKPGNHAMEELVAEEDVVGNSQSETRRLRAMVAEARAYICGFKWSPDNPKFYLAYGVGDVVAVTLAAFDRKIDGVDDRLWVVVGDLPSAYLVVEDSDCAREALSRYCDMMEDWVRAVEASSGFDNVFPVPAARTKENADLLRRRVEFLRSHITPHVSDSVV